MTREERLAALRDALGKATVERCNVVALDRSDFAWLVCSLQSAWAQRDNAVANWQADVAKGLQYKAERDELRGWINALLSENSRYIRALSAIVAQTEYGPMLTDSVIQQARAALPKEAK